MQHLSDARFESKIAVFVLLVLATCVPVQADDKTSPQPNLVFSVMGDTPYTDEEYHTLPVYLAELPKESLFAVHLGDIKTGKSPCNETVYETVAGILAKSKPPLFIIPGDNEWNDCANPDDAWALWQKHFRRFDEKWNHGLPVKRQLKRDENFAFVQSQVLLLGLNLVGGRVHDEAEWKRRLGEDLEWTQQNMEQNRDSVGSAVIFGHAYPIKSHDQYFNGLCDVATQFGKPILYIHGDGHRWIRDRPFKAQNILRVQVDQGMIAPPVKVTVTNDPKQPFVIDRMKVVD